MKIATSIILFVLAGALTFWLLQQEGSSECESCQNNAHPHKRYILASGPASRSATTSPVNVTLGAIPWPTFRGGAGMTGFAEGSLADHLTLKWSVRTGGSIKSSAVIGHGLAYIGSDDQCLYAIELKSGSVAWIYQAGGGIQAPPMLIDDVVVFGARDGVVYCVSAKDGSLRWKFKTGGEIMGSANWLNGIRDDQIVIGSYDHNLYCLDLKTGQKVWNLKTDSYVHCSAAVEEWVVTGGCDGFVRIISPDDGLEARKARPGSPQTATAPADQDGGYIAGSLAIRQGKVFGGSFDGKMFCIDVTSGSPVWSVEAEGPIYASPAVDSRHVIFAGRDRIVRCMNHSGMLLWQFQTRRAVDSSPVIAGDKVVFGSDDGRLYMIGLGNGQLLWSYDIGQAISSSPAVAGGVIVVGCEDGMVYSFGPEGAPSE